MPFVEVFHTVPAPMSTAWRLVDDVRSYPTLMENVRHLEVLEQGLGYRICEWEVALKGCIMRWIEREDIFADIGRIEYRQTSGDLERLSGIWQLDSLAADSTRVTLTVDFDIGIPMLSEMLDPIATRAIRANALTMLEGLGAHAEDLLS